MMFDNVQNELRVKYSTITPCQAPKICICQNTYKQLEWVQGSLVGRGRGLKKVVDAQLKFFDFPERKK